MQKIKNFLKKLLDYLEFWYRVCDSFNIILENKLRNLRERRIK